MSRFALLPKVSVFGIVLCLLIGVMSRSASAADAPAGKLAIVKAVYGDLPDGAKTDVTTKVADMVKDNALSVEASNDNFGDPAEGTGKKLTVDYTVDGVARSTTVNEGDTVSISGKPSKLIIRQAVYGDLPDGAKTDVTGKVAAMIKEDSVSVEASNDNFGDPAEGTGKKLKVDYTVNGVEHSKIVDEGATLWISAKPPKLVIRKATYGDLPDGAKTDVTDKVQDKVIDDSLATEASNDNFGDPAENILKKLKVDYTFEGKENSKTVNEGETLTISDKGE